MELGLIWVLSWMGYRMVSKGQWLGLVVKCSVASALVLRLDLLKIYLSPDNAVAIMFAPVSVCVCVIVRKITQE